MPIQPVSGPENLMRPFGDVLTAAPANLAPERQVELPSIFGVPPWELVFLNGTTNFKAVPDAGNGKPEIHVTYWALLGLWCVVKGAVLIADAASEALARGEKTIPSEPGTSYYTAMRYFSLCRELTKGNQVEFPGDLQAPDASATDPDQKRINNLFCGAAGWVLLHEIGHVHLKHEIEGTSELNHKKEHEADEFATKWILSGAGIPAANYQFRILVIAVAMLWLAISSGDDRDTPSHPRVSQRFNRCRDLVDTNNDQRGLELAAYLFKAAFLPHQDLGEFDTASTAFDEVLFGFARGVAG